MAWKAPFRPRTENGVTQNFDDGIVKIYTVTNSAPAGLMPVETLSDKPVYTLRYEERSFGIQRYYSARQNQIQIERVLRVPRVSDVTNQNVAITQDGKKYRIDWVQPLTDVYPPSMDLTLVKYEQAPEVTTQ